MARPGILYWQTSTPEVVLTSVLAATTQDESKRHVRASLRRHVPLAAIAWATNPNGPWQPLRELPDEWGLPWCPEMVLLTPEEEEEQRRESS